TVTVVFRVRDTGRGLSPAEQLRLFQTFTQADESTTRRFGGTGLGLVLARRLARALGGDVVLAASGLGKGSTFLVTVTADVVAPATRAEGRLAMPVSPATPATATATRTLSLVDAGSAEP